MLALHELLLRVWIYRLANTQATNFIQMSDKLAHAQWEGDIWRVGASLLGVAIVQCLTAWRIFRRKPWAEPALSGAPWSGGEGPYCYEYVTRNQAGCRGSCHEVVMASCRLCVCTVVIRLSRSALSYGCQSGFWLDKSDRFFFFFRDLVGRISKFMAALSNAFFYWLKCRGKEGDLWKRFQLLLLAWLSKLW